MSIANNNVPEAGQLPGRYEYVVEPSRGEVPTDPDFELASDVVRSFEASPGASLGRQDSVGAVDALDHNRGTEEPEFSIGYDLQRFPIDDTGSPQDPSAYGILRDSYNRLQGSLLWVARREYPGGNDDSGVREYTVVRGAVMSSVSPDLDPSSEQPILMELDGQPTKVRSYLIHQPSASTTLEIVSTSADDTMDITIENEDAGETETVTLTGDTSVTTTTEFGDIDAAWLGDNPDGDIEISDGSGTVLMTIEGGNTYSDDDQPVDGDRGVPVLGAGSHGTEIGTSYEHFVGDRFERPSGEAVRDRVNSASWTVENDINTDSVHNTRAPTVDEGNRTVTIEADIGGEYVSHASMMESLQNTQKNLEHELSGGLVTFYNTVPTDSATRTMEADQAVASLSETLEASGEPSIELTNDANL